MSVTSLTSTETETFVVCTRIKPSHREERFVSVRCFFQGHTAYISADKYRGLVLV